jgi:nucleotide-binding universal stress UspA family protein
MFKRILVPLDTSEMAEIALPYAEEMAVKNGSEVILMHVRTSADTQTNPEHKIYLDRTGAAVEERIKKSPNFPPGEKVKIVPIISGKPSILANPPEEILEYAEKESVNLIIIATHGRTGLGRWTMGSTANKVARSASCPILLIRAGAAKQENPHFGKILVTLDGSKPSEAVIPYIEYLATRLKSDVILFNAVEPPYHIVTFTDGSGYYGSAGIIKVPYTTEEMKPLVEVAEKYIRDINDKLASKGIKTSYQIKIGSAAEEIMNIEDRLRPDLVVMSTHGHSGFGRWEHGSITDKVLHAGHTPLLLIRPHQT